MIPPYYTEGMYKAHIQIYWGHTYMIEDKMGSYGKFRNPGINTVVMIIYM